MCREANVSQNQSEKILSVIHGRSSFSDFDDAEVSLLSGGDYAKCYILGMGINNASEVSVFFKDRPMDYFRICNQLISLFIDCALESDVVLYCSKLEEIECFYNYTKYSTTEIFEKAIKIKSKITEIVDKLDHTFNKLFRCSLGVHTGSVVFAKVGNDKRLFQFPIGNDRNVIKKIIGNSVGKTHSLFLSDTFAASLSSKIDLYEVGTILTHGEKTKIFKVK